LTKPPIDGINISRSFLNIDSSMVPENQDRAAFGSPIYLLDANSAKAKAPNSLAPDLLKRLFPGGGCPV